MVILSNNNLGQHLEDTLDVTNGLECVVMNFLCCCSKSFMITITVLIVSVTTWMITVGLLSVVEISYWLGRLTAISLGKICMCGAQLALSVL